MEHFSGHGCLLILKAKSLLAKVLWSTSILVSIALTIYYIINTLTKYFSYDIVASIKVFRPKEIDFPAVTFCEDSENFDFDKDLKALDCSYHKRPCEFFDIFEKVTMVYWGALTTCLRFNTRMLNSTILVKNTDRPGWEFSLYLVLYFPKHLDFYIGHNTYEPTFMNIAGVINPGVLTNVILSKTIQNNLGKPFKSGESFDSDLFRETISSGYEYRQVNCFDLCLQKKMSMNVRILPMPRSITNAIQMSVLRLTSKGCAKFTALSSVIRLELRPIFKHSTLTQSRGLSYRRNTPTPHSTRQTCSVFGYITAISSILRSISYRKCRFLI